MGLQSPGQQWSNTDTLNGLRGVMVVATVVMVLGEGGDGDGDGGDGDGGGT